MTPDVPRLPPQSDEIICWRERWRQQKIALENATRSRPGAFWNEQQTTGSFYHKSRSSAAWKEKVARQIATMNIAPGSRVLDIGAGTGTLAGPLAAMGCDVTAVEPSAPMRQGLVQALHSSGVTGITIVPERWEDITEQDLGGTFDTVIASYSLAMADICGAITKMNRVCRNRVNLFWFLTPPRWATVGKDLWGPLFGTPYSGEPLADCLWNVLYEMGIFANLSTEPEKPPTQYTTVEEAVIEYHQRFGCTTGEQDQILRSYFHKTLVPSWEGYALSGSSRGVHIWWDADGEPSS